MDSLVKCVPGHETLEAQRSRSKQRVPTRVGYLKRRLFHESVTYAGSKNEAEGARSYHHEIAPVAVISYRTNSWELTVHQRYGILPLPTL